MDIKQIIKSIFKRKETDDYNFYKNLPKKYYPKYLKNIYKQRTNKILNLSNPRRYSEKIQWLKLYDNIPIKTVLSDKLRVRDWIKEKADTLNFPEIYGVWDSFDEIEFDKLPDRFALKTNHGSGMNIFINDKKQFLQTGKEKAAALFNDWMNINFAFCYGFELQYRDIEPKIFAEERLDEIVQSKLTNYSVLCFNGKPKFIEHFMVLDQSNRYLIVYDTEWQKQSFTHITKSCQIEKEIPKPANLSEMIRISEILSAEFKLVRVDFYEVKGKLYFAEMTFTPCSGHMVFHPNEYDYILGDMLDLNIKQSSKIIF